MEFHNKRENVELIHLHSWLEAETVPKWSTSEHIMDKVKSRADRKWPELNLGFIWADRRPGHDLFTHVDRRFGIIEIYRLLRIVDRVENINTEIALKDIPFEMLDVPRQIGHPWYQHIIFILVPNLGE